MSDVTWNFGLVMLVCLNNHVDKQNIGRSDEMRLHERLRRLLMDTGQGQSRYVMADYSTSVAHFTKGY